MTADLFWPFGDLQPASFGTILADPPWAFSNWSAKGDAKNPNQHYACMPIDQIAALPVALLALPDAACLIWCTGPLLDRQIEVLRRWGFTYKGFIPWAKRSPTGASWAFGTGYGYRCAAELIVWGTRGSPKRRNASTRNLIVAPVREHSRKPPEQYEVAELWPGPYLELFSRESRPGWTHWGNEAGKFDREDAA